MERETDDHDFEEGAENLETTEESGGEEETEEQVATGGEETAEGKPAAPKLTRKERQEKRAHGTRELREVQRLNEENRALNARIAALTGTTERLTETVRATLPQPPSQEDKVVARLKRAAASIDDKNPQSVEAYFRENAAIIREVGKEVAEGIVREQIGEFAKRQPQPLTPAESRVLAQFDWIPKHTKGVEAIVNHLAASDDRDMTDEGVWEATVKEAAARYAKAVGLPVRGEGGGSAQERGRARVTGAGSRSYGGGGGDVGDGASYVANNPLARAAADRYYANIKNPTARYAKYYKEVVEPEMK